MFAELSTLLYFDNKCLNDYPTSLVLHELKGLGSENRKRQLTQSGYRFNKMLLKMLNLKINELGISILYEIYVLIESC